METFASVPRARRALASAPVAAAGALTLLTLGVSLPARAQQPSDAQPVSATSNRAVPAAGWTMPTANPQTPGPPTYLPYRGYGTVPASGYYWRPAGTPPPQPGVRGPGAPPDVPDAEQQRGDEPSSVAFDLAAETIVPLTIGGSASLEIPGRILLQGNLGWMPPGYGAAVSGLVEAFGGYDPGAGALVDAALDGAFVARVSAGWRPFSDYGFELTGGYTYVGLSGSLTAGELATAIGGNVAAAYAASPFEADIAVRSELHNFHVAIGWRWVAWEHLVIRATLGYLQTLAASSEVEISGHDELAAQATETADPLLADVYESYVKLPYLGIGAGYRF